MANYIIQDTTLIAIADSIRAKTGSTEPMLPSDMPTAIEGITGGADGCATVTFMNGSVELLSRPIYIGDDCPDPVEQGRIDRPTKESTVDTVYSHNGWTSADGGTADTTALENIAEDKTVYASFEASVRTYTVTWLDDDGTVLKTEQVAYGVVPSYTPSKDNYVFVGWSQAPIAVEADVSYTAVWEEATTFADVSWAKIAEASADGTASSRWSVGDEKTVTLTHADGTTEEITVQIAGFNHDTAEDGSTIGITCVCKNIPDIVSVIDTGNMFGYVKLSTSGVTSGSDIRELCVGDIYNSLPEDLRSQITPAAKLCNYSNNSGTSWLYTTTYDNCWLLSSNEVNGAKPSNGTTGDPLGNQYDLFATANNRKRYKNGVAVDYWLRDCVKYGSGANFAYYYTTNGATLCAKYNIEKSVCFGFCI